MTNDYTPSKREAELGFAPPGIVHDVFFRGLVQSVQLETSFQSVIFLQQHLLPLISSNNV